MKQAFTAIVFAVVLFSATAQTPSVTISSNEEKDVIEAHLVGEAGDKVYTLSGLESKMVLSMYKKDDLSFISSKNLVFPKVANMKFQFLTYCAVWNGKLMTFMRYDLKDEKKTVCQYYDLEGNPSGEPIVAESYFDSYFFSEDRSKMFGMGDGLFPGPNCRKGLPLSRWDMNTGKPVPSLKLESLHKDWIFEMKSPVLANNGDIYALYQYYRTTTDKDKDTWVQGTPVWSYSVIHLNTQTGKITEFPIDVGKKYIMAGRIAYDEKRGVVHFVGSCSDSKVALELKKLAELPDQYHCLYSKARSTSNVYMSFSKDLVLKKKEEVIFDADMYKKLLLEKDYEEGVAKPELMGIGCHEFNEIYFTEDGGIEAVGEIVMNEVYYHSAIACSPFKGKEIALYYNRRCIVSEYHYEYVTTTGQTVFEERGYFKNAFVFRYDASGKLTWSIVLKKANWIDFPRMLRTSSYVARKIGNALYILYTAEPDRTKPPVPNAKVNHEGMRVMVASISEDGKYEIKRGFGDQPAELVTHFDIDQFANTQLPGPYTMIMRDKNAYLAKLKF